MKKPFILRLLCTLIFGVFMCLGFAQDDVETQNEDYYEQFQDLENGELRSFFFFNTHETINIRSIHFFSTSDS